jgi:hypothetical protein
MVCTKSSGSLGSYSLGRFSVCFDRGLVIPIATIYNTRGREKKSRDFTWPEHDELTCNNTPEGAAGDCVCMQGNDSTSPAMDQSGLEPSSLVQVQSKKFLDRDRTNPQFFGTWTELAWTALDQSTRAESARIRWELLIH